MQASDIKEKALQLGYTACGIIPADALDEYNTHVEARMQAYPQAAELNEPLQSRVCLPDTAKSIIVCTRGYNQYQVPDSLRNRIGKYYLFHGSIPYAEASRAKDEFTMYLRVAGMGLHKLSPPARWAAAKAGIGKFGRNNFIFTLEHGSYVALDTWVVDATLTYDTLADDMLMPGCVEGCKKCVHACPTQSLTDSFSMDWSKCITHLMYKKHLLKTSEREQMGQWLYGCDACQDACPLNHGKLSACEPFPLLTAFEPHLTLEAIWEMDEDTYTEVLYPRFWYARQDGLITWKRNALRAMINTNDEKYHPIIREALNHTDPVIRELAKWGMGI